MNWLKVFATILSLAGAVCYAQNESLPIGPGDLVQITVLSTPDLAQTVRVTDAGDVPLILGGDVKLAGLTPANASKAIEGRLTEKQYLLDPHVTVVVTQFATQNVSVLGQVHTPGSYPIATPRSVIDVLALAGGLSDMGDRNITIERRYTKERINYYVANDSSKALDKAVYVNPGDTVLVPRAKFVYVLGDVARPGGYPWSTNDSQASVLQMISVAGGTLLHASPANTRLIRKGQDGSYEEMKVDVKKMQNGKIADLPLQADDIIYVPFSYARTIAMSMGSIVASASGAAVRVY